MKDQRKRLNDHGFSLVELIVVIAIIGVLVGVATPQVIKYIEKSRVAADDNNKDVIKSAVEMALVDEAAYGEVINKTSSTDKKYVITFSNSSNRINYDGSADGDVFQDELENILNEMPRAKSKGKSGFKATIENTTDNLTVTVATY